MTSTSFNQANEPCGIIGCKHPKFNLVSNRQKKNYACLFWKIQAREEEERLLSEEAIRVENKLKARSVKVFSSKDLLAAQKGYKFAGINNGAERLIPAASSEKQAELQDKLDSLPVEPILPTVVKEHKKEETEAIDQIKESISNLSINPDGDILENLVSQMTENFQTKPETVAQSNPEILIDKPVEKEFTSNELIQEFYSNRKNLKPIFHNKDHFRLILVLEKVHILQFIRNFPQLVQTPQRITKDGVILTDNNDKIVLINYQEHLKVHYQQDDYYKVFEVFDEIQSCTNDGFFFINALLSFGDHVDFGIFYDENENPTDLNFASYYHDNYHIATVEPNYVPRNKRRFIRNFDIDKNIEKVISQVTKYRLNDEERKDYVTYHVNDLFMKFGF